MERAVLATEMGTPPAVAARIGYESGRVSGVISVVKKAERRDDLEKRLKEMAGLYPEVAVFDAESSALRFSAPAWDARLEEIAFLLEKILDASAHDLKNGTFILVDHQ